MSLRAADQQECMEFSNTAAIGRALDYRNWWTVYECICVQTCTCIDAAAVFSGIWGPGPPEKSQKV